MSPPASHTRTCPPGTETCAGERGRPVGAGRRAPAAAAAAPGMGAPLSSTSSAPPGRQLLVAAPAASHSWAPHPPACLCRPALPSRSVCENIPIVLCGNKVDVKNRQVKPKQVRCVQGRGAGPAAVSARAAGLHPAAAGPANLHLPMPPHPAPAPPSAPPSFAAPPHPHPQVTFHRKKNLQYHEISAKSNYNYEKPFLYLARKLVGDPNLHFVEQVALAPPEVQIDIQQQQEYEKQLQVGGGPAAAAPARCCPAQPAAVHAVGLSRGLACRVLPAGVADPRLRPAPAHPCRKLPTCRCPTATTTTLRSEAAAWRLAGPRQPRWRPAAGGNCAAWRVGSFV